MGKSSGDAPAPPDPTATAAAQAAANKEAVRESALVNQINQVNPFGVLTYTGEIGKPDRTATTTFNPTVQGTIDTQQKLAEALAKFAYDPMLNNVKQNFSQPLNYEGITQLPGTEDLLNASQPVEQATYQRALNLLRPEFDTQKRRTEGDLVNRGLYQGSEAYNTEVDRLERSQNRALEDTALAAVGAGRSEQSRLFNQAQAARQQGITERERLRSQPLNELAALLQGSPAINTPQFGAPAQYQVAPADVSGAINNAYAGQMNAYNQNRSANNAAMGGLFGLGGSAISAAPFLF